MNVYVNVLLNPTESVTWTRTKWSPTSKSKKFSTRGDGGPVTKTQYTHNFVVHVYTAEVPTDMV